MVALTRVNIYSQFVSVSRTFAIFIIQPTLWRIWILTPSLNLCCTWKLRLIRRYWPNFHFRDSRAVLLAIDSASLHFCRISETTALPIDGVETQCPVSWTRSDANTAPLYLLLNMQIRRQNGMVAKQIVLSELGLCRDGICQLEIRQVFKWTFCWQLGEFLNFVNSYLIQVVCYYQIEWLFMEASEYARSFNN